MAEPYPTQEDLNGWDDASLFSSVGFRASDRFGRHGIDSLNEPERVLCCLFVFHNAVSNGGLEGWLFQEHPAILASTIPAIEKIGATEMAKFVREVASVLDHPSAFRSHNDWLDSVESLPDEVAQRIESVSNLDRFAELEDEFLMCAYGYARENWDQIREP